MSVGYEFLFFALLLHGAVAFLMGFFWSLIPRKLIGLVAFVLFYLAIAAWYTATFNFSMLIYSTFFVPYVIIGLVGLAFGTLWLGKRGYYKKAKSQQKRETK